jgi:trimeric autotransporter adhesin
MKSWLLLTVLLLVSLCLTSLTAAQEAATTATKTSTANVVPSRINYTGVLKDASGHPVNTFTGVTFLLYRDEEGGSPLWMETQNVTPDKAGRYVVQLGAASQYGIPQDLFTNGEAHWLAVQIGSEPEQARVLLLSVPYALKAADAETLGGLPASAFALATKGTFSKAPVAPAMATPSPASSSAPPPGSANVTTAGGSAQHLAMFTTATNIQNSIASQIGITAINVLGKLGINTAAPAQSLDITSGNAIVRGVGNFKMAGNEAFLYVGDTSHPIEAIWNTGLAIGVFLVPQALFIQDRTGNVGIGTTTPDAGLEVKSVKGLAGDFRTAKTGSTALSVTGGPGSANLPGGLGFKAVGGHNNADGGAGGVGASFTGGSGAGLNQIGQGGTGASFQGGAGPQGNIFQGGIGLVSIGGEGDGFAGGGGDGAHLEGAFGIGGGTGVVASGGGGDPSACGGMFFGGPGVSQGGGFACVGGGNNERLDVGADGIDASSVASDTRATYAGNFTGDLNVTGTIFAGTKDFRIDHPLAPANKYLSHASVESSEMKNIYDGIVTLDASGAALVELPSWFEALNGNFRYQLTAIGKPSPGLYVADEISGNRFSVAGGTPGAKVSWQVTGVRQDPYAKAHPLIVEQEKEVHLKGFYLRPELYGAPEERQIEWARHPQMMKKMKELRARQLAASHQSRKQLMVNPSHLSAAAGANAR